ncbi:MAG: response regulator transcription factor, partial [Campylobacterota bacterium]|nr:response regulator transcription factor [Campylobacterota bacterium]
LQKEDFETIGFLNSKKLYDVLDEESVDLIIMDRNLGGGVEGSEVVNSIREDGYNVPVIFLTAKDKDVNIEEGFERGGDDYITKPFKMKELILRIKAILKRTKSLSKQENSISYQDIELNVHTHRVHVDGELVELTKLEFDLLYTLIKNRGNVLDREYLLLNVWGNDEIYQDRTVNVAINRLKEKIDPSKSKEYIKTVRGVGYTLC